MKRKKKKNLLHRVRRNVHKVCFVAGFLVGSGLGYSARMLVDKARDKVCLTKAAKAKAEKTETEAAER